MNKLYSSVFFINSSFVLFGFLSPTPVTLIPSFFLYVAMVLNCSFAVFYFRKNPVVDRSFLLFILLVLSPTLISLASLSFGFIFEYERFDFFQLSILGRISNLLVLTTIFLFYYSHNKNRNPLLILRAYQFGILLVLITAIWQAMDIYFGLFNFPFDTRSHLHSTYGETYSIAERLTGISKEPSFLVVLVIDFIALTLLLDRGLKKKVFLVLSFIVLTLSFSPTGFVVISFSIIFSIFFLLLKFRVKKVKFISFFSILALLFILFGDFTSTDVVKYIVNRVLEVDPDSSGRLYMLLMPFYWVSESNFLSIIFGHGIKTYSIIGTQYMLPSGFPVHVTSNSLYVDVFWEAGLIGLGLALAPFFYLFMRATKSNYSKKQVFLAYFVIFEIAAACVFRADYASPRYFLMMYLGYYLTHHDIRYFLGRK